MAPLVIEGLKVKVVVDIRTDLILISESLLVNIPEGTPPMATREYVVAETNFIQLYTRFLQGEE